MSLITTNQSTPPHVPAFLAKLWKIVDDPSTNELICWSEHGNSFIIHNQSEFSRDLLPLYYKHNNMASFVRQLNMYGFHKVVSVEHGGLRVDKDEMEFAHPFFLQGQEDSLELIKRKVSSKFSTSANNLESAALRLATTPENYNKVLQDVHQMKGRQESMDSKLMQVRRENEALWTELASLRQKHAKQQQIVSKLIQFLVTMMSSQQQSASHRIGFKRRMMPLMLADAESGEESNTKMSRGNSAMGSGGAGGTSGSGTGGKKSKATPTATQQQQQLPTMITDESESGGATIHDVTELEDENLNEGAESADGGGLFVTEILEPNTPPSVASATASKRQQRANQQLKSETPIVTTATPTNIQQQQQQNYSNLQTISNLNNSLGNPSAGIPDPKLYVAEELDGHLGQTQLTLDSLREMLMGSSFNVEPGMLSGVSSSPNLLVSALFAPDTEMTINPPASTKENNNKDGGENIVELLTPDFDPTATTATGQTANNPNYILGNELTTYNPCLFELADVDDGIFGSEVDGFNSGYLDVELDNMMTTEKRELVGSNSNNANSN